MQKTFFKKQNNFFQKRVLKIVQAIPSGTTLSYSEVARKAGNAKAARAVGAIMAANHNPQVPCHRVIRADGSLGGYNRGKTRKQKLLISEGIEP